MKKPVLIYERTDLVGLAQWWHLFKFTYHDTNFLVIADGYEMTIFMGNDFNHELKGKIASRFTHETSIDSATAFLEDVIVEAIRTVELSDRLIINEDEK